MTFTYPGAALPLSLFTFLYPLRTQWVPFNLFRWPQGQGEQDPALSLPCRTRRLPGSEEPWVGTVAAPLPLHPSYMACGRVHNYCLRLLEEGNVPSLVCRIISHPWDGLSHLRLYCSIPYDLHSRLSVHPDRSLLAHHFVVFIKEL